ncbi:erythrocyte membrane protein 1, PfEMP1, putative [Plasmodium reichenowi]|uniref:Erythrocyte membrane protein 1, PfEMP1, putative n=1 Tax=Plasmodium reichenowi TaxID=5854 RepID=A0A2P9DSX9_PLARE|nr:erythrocyte membrane protein 1, PfEMP1, putative [Plasmodium reichenowi]
MVTGGGGSGTQDAKHVLDEIGQQVYNDKVKKEAQKYKDELEGKLSFASIFGEETVSTNDPCELQSEYTKLINGGGGKRHPCANRSKIRFSDESRSQCTFNRIKDNKTEDNKCGACAPFRRLSVCDYNLEKISTKKNKARHNLLAEVCMAANYEAQSLINYREQYDSKYHDTGFTPCTMLARSFADIGDIIRGKDLYLGDKGEKKKLEDKLKQNFKNIYEGLSKNGAQKRYQDDSPDFFKLREDWWNANRKEVWKAITCKADDSNRYFRVTCNDSDGKSQSQANHKCRCPKSRDGKANDQVPTYLDYVPQYLRWFEEWAEDFCRKRKHKLEEAKKACRGDNGEDKYCSRNGYDCKETIRGINKLVKSEECTKCSVLCTPFVEWIENKQKEFEKQKKKFENEIQKKDQTATSIKIGDKTINNLYVKDFYSKLQQSYGNVDAFLRLLNQETTCKDHPEVEVNGKKANSVDFTEEKIEDIFSHTEYCETCPLCARKEKKDGKWEDKNYEGKCPKEGLTLFDDNESTVIELLLKDKDGTNIMEKLKSLCGKGANDKKYDKWKCYYDKNKEESDGDKDYCVLQDGNQATEKRTIQPFDVLFPNWINEMLKDSIEWRKELDKCINDKATSCIRGCKKNCECFKKWVEQKETEWQQLEKHYEKEVFEGDFTPYMTLEMNLKHTYFPIIEEANKEEKPVKEMEKIIEENYGKSEVSTDKNSINDFLQEEKKIATKCTSTHNDEKCKPPPPPPPAQSPGRSLDQQPTRRNEPEPKEDDESSSEDSDIDEENLEEEEETNEDEKEKETVKTKEDDVNPCDIVKELFEKPDNTFKEACDLKYNKGKNYGWRCVPSGKSGEKDGAICIPPRRRKLYIGKIKKWARDETAKGSRSQEGQKTLQAEGESSVSGSTGEGKGSESSGGSDDQKTPVSRGSEASSQSDGKTASQQPDPLLKAFVESAAVETFFLWDRYKKEWESQHPTPQVGVLPGVGVAPGGAAVTGLMGPQGLRNNIFGGSSGSVFGRGPNSEGPSPAGPMDGLLNTSGLQVALGENSGNSGQNLTPQSLLSSGTIPLDFLRQMFYTLGDYRDILVGKTPEGIDKVIVRGNKDESGKNTMETIKTAIDQMLSKPSGTEATGGVKKPVKTEENSGLTRQTWWKDHAPQIWHGMICALTYKEKDTETEARGTDDNTNKIEKIEHADEILGKLKTKDGKEGDYHYNKVTLSDENDGEMKTNDDEPTLKQFTSRPTYFRYLEEWGETFCVTRQRLLKNVKDKCHGLNHNGNRIYCSGDGHDCTHSELRHKDILADLDCRPCYEQCTKYKKWIDLKFEEYHNQKSKYQGERQKVINGNSGCGEDNTKFCEEIKKNYDSAAEYLKALKHCKDGQTDGEKKSSDPDNNIDFGNPLETFGPLDYCKTCPPNIVNCNSGGRRTNPGQDPCKVNFNGNEWKSVFNGIPENSGKTTTIEVEMIDRRAPFIKEYLGNSGNSNDLFKNSRLFKGKREQKWECRYKGENMDVCYLKNFNDKIDLNEYTTFKVFLEYWLEDFLYGYNILKKRKIIEKCTKKGENTCDEKSKNYCECIGNWLDKKKGEWETIKKYYDDNFKDEGEPIYSRIRSFFEQGLFDSDLKKGKGNYKSLEEYEKSVGCNCTANSKNSKDADKKDIVECIHEDVGKKISECQSKHSDQPQAQCQTLPLVGDDPLEEEEENPENKVEKPAICGDMPTTEDTVVEDEEECKPAEKKEVKKEDKEKEEQDGASPGSPPESTTENREEPQVPDNEDKTPAAPVKPTPAKPPKQQEQPKKQSRRYPRHVESPYLKPALVSNALMWSVGIGFVALSYWLLKKYIEIYSC